MKMDQLDPEKMNLDELIKLGHRLHGHLGPYLVAGIRMGLLALKELDSTGHKELKATVETGSTPPVSCLIDGIQVATGCTAGKGNLEVTSEGVPEATFSREDNRFDIALTEQAKDVINQQEAETGAKKLKTMPDKDLFQWTRKQ